MDLDHPIWKRMTETRYPIECDCGVDPEQPEHVICSACGDDWDECECGAPDLYPNSATRQE